LDPTMKRLAKLPVINSSKEIWWILTLYMILERKLMF
jgi:hypothetical protein